MRRLFIALLLLASSTLFAQTTDNDNSCDISLAPAATLLLPYFEVSLQQGQETTLFTIQNVTANPQIARVTIWTDYGYPLFTFNLYIGGYGVAPINLYDVLVSGRINPGTPPDPHVSNPTTGTQPLLTNAQIDVSACSSAPITLQPAVVSALQQALRLGRATTACGDTVVGSAHPNMIGYATIDLVANCSAHLPSDPAYFTSDLLFDNVLTGDDQQYVMQGPNGLFVGNSLVHIRAVPEGGPAGQVGPTNLPYTFYDRMTKGLPVRTIDRRQPLPSTFVARWIGGGPTSFASDFRIWREVPFGNDASCSDYGTNATQTMEEIVRFDEHENASVTYSNLPIDGAPKLPATARINNSGGTLPYPTTNDLGGWLYFALSNSGSTSYSVSGTHTYARPGIAVRQSQAWVVSSFSAAGKYVVSNDAIALGNGCSAAPPTSSQQQLGPAPNPSP